MAKKRNERKTLKNACMREAKKIAKERDNYTCQRCGKKAADGWKIDASHVIPDGRCEALNTDPLNMKALCFTCHKLWWHMSPLEAGVWFAETFPDRAKYLIDKLNEFDKTRMGIQWWRDWRAELKEINNG